MIAIGPADFDDPVVRALIEHHLDGMRAHSPACGVHAIGVESLQASDVTLRIARRDGQVAGMGALRMLGGGAGELKSFRTGPGHLRQGIAAALLDHLIAKARAAGLTRLSLETGSGLAFDAALALYRSRGFASGPAFGDYEASDFNQFLHLDL